MRRPDQCTDSGLLIEAGWTLDIPSSDAVRYALAYRAGRRGNPEVVAGFFDFEDKVVLSHGPGKIMLERDTALAIIGIIEKELTR